MSFSVVMRKNGRVTGRLGPYPTQAAAKPDAQELADLAVPEVQVSIERTGGARKNRRNPSRWGHSSTFEDAPPPLWARNKWSISWFDDDKHWRGFWVQGPSRGQHPNVLSLDTVAWDWIVPAYVEAAVKRLAKKHADEVIYESVPAWKNPKHPRRKNAALPAGYKAIKKKAAALKYDTSGKAQVKPGWTRMMYPNDLLEHDKTTISEHPRSSFLWFISEYGTHVFMLTGEVGVTDVQLSKSLSTYNYLVEKYHDGIYQDSVYYWNGKTLRKVTPKEGRHIVEDSVEGRPYEKRYNRAKWVQGVDREMEEEGTVGAFTKQARRAGYKNTMEFARKVMAGWRSGKKTVFNKRTRKQQRVTKKTMNRANFAINVQKRNPKQPRLSAMTKPDLWNLAIQMGLIWEEGFPHFEYKNYTRAKLIYMILKHEDRGRLIPQYPGPHVGPEMKYKQNPRNGGPFEVESVKEIEMLGALSGPLQFEDLGEGNVYFTDKHNRRFFFKAGYTSDYEKRFLEILLDGLKFPPLWNPNGDASWHEGFDRYEQMPYWEVHKGKKSAVFQSWIYGEKRARHLALRLYGDLNQGASWQTAIGKIPLENPRKSVPGKTWVRNTLKAFGNHLPPSTRVKGFHFKWYAPHKGSDNESMDIKMFGDVFHIEVLGTTTARGKQGEIRLVDFGHDTLLGTNKNIPAAVTKFLKIIAKHHPGAKGLKATKGPQKILRLESWPRASNRRKPRKVWSLSKKGTRWTARNRSTGAVVRGTPGEFRRTAWAKRHGIPAYIVARAKR